MNTSAQKNYLSRDVEEFIIANRDMEADYSVVVTHDYLGIIIHSII